MSAEDFTAIYDALIAQHGIKSASDMAIARTLARLMAEDGGDAVKQAEGIARLRALLPTPPQSECRAYVQVEYVPGTGEREDAERDELRAEVQRLRALLRAGAGEAAVASGGEARHDVGAAARSETDEQPHRPRRGLRPCNP
jgi:hypothetical protein